MQDEDYVEKIRGTMKEAGDCFAAKPPSIPPSDKKGFESNFEPMEKGTATTSVIEEILKRPARVIYEIIKGNSRGVCASLLLIISLCMIGYGVVMGFFSGGHQLWMAPLKVTIGLYASALICLPSLYIFSCICGGDQSFSQVWNLLLATLALSSLLLIGFAPVAWIFSQSTDTIGFMGFTHLLFWLVGMGFGLELLKKAFLLLNKRSLKLVRLWSIIFVLVALQMCTVLRPLIGEYDGFRLQGKKSFITHIFRSFE